MGHTYTNLLTHIIFSTKGRAPLLSPVRRVDIFDYTRGIFRGIHCDLLAVNGVADHLHIAARMRPSLSVSDVVQTVKANSSKWINETQMFRGHFSWQRGYGAFSVSESNIEKLLAYIARQEDHHRKVSFQQELLLLLNLHKTAHDTPSVVHLGERR